MAIDIEKIQDSKHILDILIQCEDILDSLDIYVYKNWFNGEIISGPSITKYWVTFGLSYPLDKMPDPRASLRLLKYGIKVKFEKRERQIKHNVYNYPDTQEKPEDDMEWIISISFPRRLLTDLDSADDDFYEDDVNIDDVDSAKDSGMDNESVYMTDEQNPNGQENSNNEQLPTQ